MAYRNLNNGFLQRNMRPFATQMIMNYIHHVSMRTSMERFTNEHHLTMRIRFALSSVSFYDNPFI